jgi:aryl-alcohol dehydrogenase-like predicted oxidoreductase
VDEATALETLTSALDHGVTFLDTAPAYGDGRSELLIGQAVRGRRESVVLASKIGYRSWSAPPTFDVSSALRSLEGSLQRLDVQRLDLLQLHSPPPDLATQDDGLFARLTALREEGVVGALGVSVKSPEHAFSFLETDLFDSIQVNFNMLDMRAEECGLFAEARRRDCAVIVRTPLCFGFLSGALTPDSVYPPGDHRLGWSPAQRARWIEGGDAMRAALAGETEPGETPAQTAIRFCLTPEAVAVVIPGVLTHAEAVENARAGSLPSFSRESYAAVQAINRRTDFFLPPEQARTGAA